MLNQEISADSVEQYSRRANIRVCGIPEAYGGGEDTDEKVLAVLNSTASSDSIGSNDAVMSSTASRYLAGKYANAAAEELGRVAATRVTLATGRHTSFWL